MTCWAPWWTGRARADLDVVLVTSDKDMLQLVGPRVRVLAPGQRAGEQVLYDADKVREKWGVGPEQIPDLLALMGDAIDNIPGVPGVGQKTAVKLIGQFNSVDGLYEHLTLVPGKLRETLAANRKQALLSRELATVSTRVPIPDDLEALRRREPDWERLRALWTELELRTLLRQLPEEPGAAAAVADEAPADSPEALAAFLAKVPPGERIAVDWAGEGGPPRPDVTRVGLHHPVAGDVLVAAEALGDLGGRALIGHDVKPLLEWWLARGVPAPPVEDTAVAAYLLNSARSNYKLEEVCAEHLGEGPGLARPGSRARWIWQLWEQEARELREATLRSLYDEIERPLIPVLAAMERHGVTVDPARLAEFSKELDRSLGNLTAEIYALAGEEFNLGSPKQLATILFEKLGLPPVRKTKTGYSTDADVLEQLALGHALPRQDHRAPHPGQAQVHLRGRAAPHDQRRDRAHPHLAEPARGGDGKIVVAVPEPPEHTRAHRAGPPHPRRLRARAGLALRGRRLLADRAAPARACLRRGEPGGGLPARRGHSPAHRLGGVRRAARGGDVHPARRRQDHQLLRDLRGHRLRACARARHLLQGGAGVPRPLLRAPSQGAGVPRRDRQGRAQQRLRADAVRPAPLSAGAAQRQPQPARLRGADGDERAHPGHRRRPHQDRHDPDGAGAG